MQNTHENMGHPASLEIVDDHQLLPGMVIGRSAAMQKVAAMVRQVAMFPTTVLLQGESGTGKDMVARAIHQLSARAQHQFVDINCAAIPTTLLETELFGVEEGAYTDARATREGYLSRADKGTLFLDEIGSMPFVLQAKLLRVLETHSFRRVGSIKEIRVDLRVISATNINLQAAVVHRTFRGDLLYRLNVVTIVLPPLRERPEDIEPLVKHFLQLYSIEGEVPLSISSEALDLLLHYDWPGNIRELRGAIQHGQVLCDNAIILPRDLPEHIRKVKLSGMERLREVRQQLHLPPEGVDLRTFLNDIEDTFIQEALERCHGNQVQAAALLRISRDQLRYRLAQAHFLTR